MTRAMKDSGIEWIGDIPEEWEYCRIKYNTYLKGRIGWQGLKASEFIDEGPYLVTGTDFENGLVNWDVCYHITNERYEEAPEIQLIANDLLITKDGTVGKLAYIEILPDKASLNSHLLVIRPKSKRFINKYLFWVFSSNCFNIYTGLSQDGTIMASLSQEKISNFSFAVPPLHEQQTTADFLNCKCNLIDSIIEKQKSVIEKLKLYKQAVITEAVTKGLDRTVKMKSSGIVWIGEIPEKWVVGQLKFFATIRSGITLGKKYSPGTELVEYPYLRVANVQGGYTDLTDVSTILITEEEALKHKLQVGEVLMTEGGDRDKLGRGCIWYGEIENCLHQNHVFAVRTEESKLDAKFFDYITTSDVGRNYFDFTAKKTTNLASTNSTTILEFRFPVPKIDAQKEIISYLDTKCFQIDAIITGKQSLINKLTDYKKSLIYECVTGKREVV